MKKLVIEKSSKLIGKIKISGSKNTSLPILMSTILFKEDVILDNIPDVQDVRLTLELLENFGVKIEKLGKNKFKINAKDLNSHIAPYEIVKQMRASFYALGVLLGRLGKAEVSLPGGCVIGNRPVDIHLTAFEKMGAIIENNNGYIKATAKNGKLDSAEIDFRFPSVGATMNVIMAAVLGNSKTIINNCAKEPDIIDFANFLIKAGANIKGAGTEKIEIIGVEKLNPTEYTVIGDRIEAGTYMIGALITDGDLILEGLNFNEVLVNVIDKLKTMGADIENISENSIRIKRGDEKLKPLNIITEVYPGFPTDLQAQMMALLANINGKSTIDETIFENRFMHVPELNRMGACIILKNNKAHIYGKENCYHGAKVMASDLRAGASLMLAGISAEGGTTIDRYYHMERGYEDLVEKLTKCGAFINISNDE